MEICPGGGFGWGGLCAHSGTVSYDDLLDGAGGHRGDCLDACGECGSEALTPQACGPARASAPDVNNNNNSVGGVAGACPVAGVDSPAMVGAGAPQQIGKHQGRAPVWTDRPDGLDPDWITVRNIAVTEGEEDYVFDVTVRETFTENVADFRIQRNCMAGSCSCTHMIEGVVSQMKPCRVFTELFMRGDTDPDAEYILMGVCFGFMVINWDCEACYDCKQGAGGDPADREAMSAKLRREIEAGALTVVSRRPTCVHRLFCIPKDGGGIRGIVDCSRPEGESVNNYTDEVTVKFSYSSVDDVAELMQRGDYLATVDIRDAYRAVSIHPRDRDRQGIFWDFGDDPVFLRDNRLCMGLSSSPYVFSKLSDFIVRCAVREGAGEVVNYLDDFCLVARDFESGCAAQAVLMAILRRLGFYISFPKVTSPATKTRFLGIDIDTVALEMTLPEDKLVKMTSALVALEGRKRATRIQLERLAGLLAHCAKVVRGGRTFCRRIYDAVNAVAKPHYKVRLSGGFHEDRKWWLDFARRFNGKAKIIGRHTPYVSTYSDASGGGFGTIHDSDWRVGAFDHGTDEAIRNQVGHHHATPDPTCAGAHINVLEMWAAFCAAQTWGHRWRDSTVVMVTDNETVRAALTSGRSKSKGVMYFIRRLFWIAAEHNFDIQSVYVRSADNTICDALSRWEAADSMDRIRAADGARRLCCSHIFTTPSNSSSSSCGAAEGETEVPATVLRPKFHHDTGRPSKEIPAVH